MTIMQRRLSVSTLLVGAMLTGCARPEVPVVAQPRTLAVPSVTAGTGLGFKVLAQPNGWQPSDIDRFEVIVSHAGTPVATIELTQQGEAPRSKVRLSNLQLGKTYQVSILAMHGQAVINLQNPTELSFTFTGDQDVEDLFHENVTITLDDVFFSGTVTIPLTALSFGGSSRKLLVTLQAMSESSPDAWEAVFSKEYLLPAGGYRDYQIWNLAFGRNYRVKLDSYNPSGNINMTRTSEVFTFPDPTQTTYALDAGDFQ